MKSYYSINIKAAMQVGLRDVDFNDLALYEFCKDAIMWEDSKPLWHDERQWRWVSYDLIKTNIPYLNASNKTLYRMLVKLCNVGLIERCPVNKKKGMVFLAIGPIGLKMERLMRDFTSDKNVRDLGQNCPTPRTNLSEYSNIEDSKKKIVNEKEAHAQENEKPTPIEQPKPSVEQPKPKAKSTLDFPTCEGHGIKVQLADYPKQGGENSPPFIHPSLVLNIPIAKRIDLWWKLYGKNEGRYKTELEMLQEGVADDEKFAAIYLHTFLYVAVTEPRFRLKPMAYFRNRAWKDDITDYRKKKEDQASKQLGEGGSKLMDQSWWTA